MGRKNKRGERFSFSKAMGFSAPYMYDTFYRQPMVHINCAGWLEIENCRGILLYDENHLRLDMGKVELRLEGDALRVDTYQKNLMTVRGRIFSVGFSYKGGNGH